MSTGVISPDGSDRMSGLELVSDASSTYGSGIGIAVSALRASGATVVVGVGTCVGSLCLAVSVVLFNVFLPARRVAKYSQFRLRLTHRTQLGFSLEHLSFEAAQAWQLSLNFGVEF
ncbi:hypothetical protein LQW54_008127 [Pestalotiopsis sp. IQ-011]